MMKKMSGGGMMKMMKRMGAMKGMMGGSGSFPGMPR
jgi:signal recognition particle subunit SRP54